MQSSFNNGMLPLQQSNKQAIITYAAGVSCERRAVSTSARRVELWSQPTKW